MNLISEFRHAIVHDRGFLDKAVLKDKLVTKQGINGDTLRKEYEKYIKNYYGKNEYKSLICLIPISLDSGIGGLLSNYDRRSILTQYILSYAHLLTELSIEYLNKEKSNDQ